MYTVKTTSQFDKEFKKLDKFTQRILSSWIDKNLEGCENPRILGKNFNLNFSQLLQEAIKKIKYD